MIIYAVEINVTVLDNAFTNTEAVFSSKELAQAWIEQSIAAEVSYGYDAAKYSIRDMELDAAFVNPFI